MRKTCDVLIFIDLEKALKGWYLLSTALFSNSANTFRLLDKSACVIKKSFLFLYQTYVVCSEKNHTVNVLKFEHSKITNT